MNRSTVFNVLMILNAVLLPCGCLSVSAMIGYNPFAKPFLTNFHVTNATREPLIVTPLGAFEPNSPRHTLPFHEPASGWERKQVRDFLMKPGETLTFTYDMDDITLSELVIERPATGESRQYSIDFATSLAETSHTITDFDALDDLTPAAALGHNAEPRTRWWVLIVTFIPWLTFPVLLYLRTRHLTRRPPVKS